MKIIKEHKKANAIVASLLVTLLVIAVILSIMGIYIINKMYTIKSLNDYYDKQITQQLKENNKSK